MVSPAAGLRSGDPHPRWEKRSPLVTLARAKGGSTSAVLKSPLGKGVTRNEEEEEEKEEKKKIYQANNDCSCHWNLEPVL